MSEPYDPDNLLDRLADPAAMAMQYAQVERRERELLDRRLGMRGGAVLSIGCGWHPGRHLFPAPAWHLTGVDLDPAKVAAVLERGLADEALVGAAGKLDALPDDSFDVVLARMVLHHVAYQGPLEPVFAEATRLLRPSGVLVVVEPGLWHPVGLGLAGANAVGLGPRIHGTPDDVPLSPRRLLRTAQEAGLEPEIHAVTFAWRRLPVVVQGALRPLDDLGSRPRARMFGHTLMLIARCAPARRNSSACYPLR